MIATSNLQTLQLDPLTPGVEYLFVLTNSPGANTLQFKHHSDPTTRDLPVHTAVTGAVVVTKFLCPAPQMALVFAEVPGAPYYVSLTPLTTPEF